MLKVKMCINENKEQIFERIRGKKRDIIYKGTITMMTDFSAQKWISEDRVQYSETKQFLT